MQYNWTDINAIENAMAPARQACHIVLPTTSASDHTRLLYQNADVCAGPFQIAAVAAA